MSELNILNVVDYLKKIVAKNYRHKQSNLNENEELLAEILYRVRKDDYHPLQSKNGNS
jgi:hypothetical protein